MRKNYILTLVGVEIGFVLMYGAGTILGPLIGATIVDFNTQYGYWVFASLLCLGFFLLFKFCQNGNSQ
jgi:uncharacterized protein YqgC (DUF456 family)